MKIEDAIEDFNHFNNNLIGCLGNVAECEPDYINRKLAILALTEKAEREKGCEYCENTSQAKSMWHRKLPHGKYIQTDAHFCPVCGRNLRGENDE